VCFQYGKTALHLAAQRGHVGVIKFLVEHGTQVDAKDKVRVDMYKITDRSSMLCHFTVRFEANLGSQFVYCDPSRKTCEGFYSCYCITIIIYLITTADMFTT